MRCIGDAVVSEEARSQCWWVISIVRIWLVVPNFRSVSPTFPFAVDRKNGEALPLNLI